MAAIWVTAENKQTPFLRLKLKFSRGISTIKKIRYYYTYGTVGYHVVLGGKENF